MFPVGVAVVRYNASCVVFCVWQGRWNGLILHDTHLVFLFVESEGIRDGQLCGTPSNVCEVLLLEKRRDVFASSSAVWCLCE